MAIGNDTRVAGSLFTRNVSTTLIPWETWVLESRIRPARS